MHTAPTWVIKPHFRQGEITDKLGSKWKQKATQNSQKVAKMAKMARRDNSDKWWSKEEQKVAKMAKKVQ